MRRSFPMVALTSVAAIALLAACAQPTIDDPASSDAGTTDTSGGETTTTGMTCVGCHTDKEMLQEVVAELYPEDPNAEEPEESGDG